jgi:hypothetical protein
MSAAGQFTYSTSSPPTVTVDAVDPSQGTLAGGTEVAIYGRGFSGGVTSVKFGGNPAPGFFAFSDNTLFTQSPAGTATGPVAVTLTAAGGTATSQFTYVPATAPAVVAVEPNQGPATGNTPVTIFGHGLSGTSQVRFGATATFGFFVGDDNHLFTQSPPGVASVTPVDVIVTTSAGSSATNTGDRFTYGPAVAPMVTAVKPSSGPSEGGTTVYIRGSNLSGAMQVRFGTPTFQRSFGFFFPVSDGLIQATSPPQGTNPVTVDVTVVTPAGSSSVNQPADQFTYTTTPAPAVTVISPSSGPANGGTLVWISGTGLANPTAVSFGGVQTFNFFGMSDGLMQAVSPPGATGSVNITVTTPSGTSQPTAFTYTTLLPPEVTALGPDTGSAGGGTVTFISGNNLGGVTGVQFGTVQTFRFFNISDSLIRAVSPTASTGRADVTVTTRAGTSNVSPADQFTYTTALSPTLRAVSPSTGQPGTSAVITGTGLFGATAVSFGISQAAFFNESDTLLFTLVPPGAPGTPVDVTVTTGAGASTLVAAYTYGAAENPIVNVVSPNIGVAGTTVFVTGTGLGGASTVTFGDAAAANFFIHSDTLVEATSPPGNGTVDIIVTTAVGPSSKGAADRFTYASAPGPPTHVTAGAGDALAVVSWMPPDSNGGSPITSYTVTSSPDAIQARVDGNTTTATVTGLTNGVSYTFTATASNVLGNSPASAPSNAVTPMAPAPPPPPPPPLPSTGGRGHHHSMSPARILDTRDGTGGLSAARLGQGSTLDVQVAGQGGVPATGVSSAVLNVTVTDTSAPGYLVVYAKGIARPLASNLNWVAGQTVANLVEVPLSADGKVTVFNSAGSTDVIFDLAGYVSTPDQSTSTDGLYNPLVPARLLDTRTGLGGATTVGAGGTVSVQVTGRGNVPASGVSAVVLNVTATNPTASSYVTAWPEGAIRPLASNLNFVAGQTVPNRVIAKVGTGGKVDLYNFNGKVDLVVDVGGYFTDATAGGTGSGFNPLTSARVVDTRNGIGGFSSPVGAGGLLSLQVAGQSGVPAMSSAIPPTAVVLNVAVTNPTADSFLTVWPAGSTQPIASDLNYGTGQTRANFVVVKVGADGKINLFNLAGSTDVVIDVVGWYG